MPSGSLADPLFSVRRNVSTARHQPLIELPSTFSGIWFYRVFLRIEFRFQAVPGALDSVLLGFTGFSGTLMSVPVWGGIVNDWFTVLPSFVFFYRVWVSSEDFTGNGGLGWEGASASVQETFPFHSSARLRGLFLPVDGLVFFLPPPPRTGVVDVDVVVSIGAAASFQWLAKYLTLGRSAVLATPSCSLLLWILFRFTGFHWMIYLWLQFLTALYSVTKLSLAHFSFSFF